MNPCVSIQCAPSNIASLERVRYFPGQLLAPDDMLLEQAYFRNRLRRHNRFLHGWGVVCGANVKPDPDKKPWKVIVEPGYLLDPLGNEILIDREVSVDLRCEDAVDPCADQLDPWCSDVVVDRDPERPLYIAVCYAECLARPVRVQLNGCGCDATECEYSRVRDSFSIKVRDKPIDNFPCQPPDPRQHPLGCPPGGMRDCPPCPDDPCIGLAKIMVPADGIIKSRHIDTSCRRMAVSFANHWLCCPRGRSTEEIAGGAYEIRVQDPSSGTAALSLPIKEFQFETSTQDILDEYGEEQLNHPMTGQPFTFRHLVAAAGIQPDEIFRSTEDLMYRLESNPVALQDYISARSVLSPLLHAEALAEIDEQMGGQLRGLANVKASSITVPAVSEAVSKAVSEAVGERTITELIDESEDNLVNLVLHQVPVDVDAEEATAGAKAWWTRLQRVKQLIDLGSDE